MKPRPQRRVLGIALAATLSALSVNGWNSPANADTPPVASASAPASTAPLDEAHASLKAQATGKPVAVGAATTPTAQEVANPDGTFTLTQSVAPVRKYTSGGWKSLDADLARRSDGAVAPALTTDGLTLSGGGNGPLAEMKDLGRSLSLSLPTSIPSLPTPSLDGPTATYSDVFPDVDLKVTADAQGGFSEVLVVKNAQAATNPALATLSFPAHTDAVTLSADAAGNIRAKDTSGNTVFAAPAPLMWDSATTESATTAFSATSDVAEAPSGAPDPGDPGASSAEAPGPNAHVAPVQAEYTSGTIKLTTDADLLTGTSTVYPLYIDPSYTASGGKLQNWTYVDSHWPDNSYWDTTDSKGLRVGYNGWDAPYYKAEAFAKLSVSSQIYGATIVSSTFYATEIYAPSCTDKRPVEVWETGAISSATTWDSRPTWKTKLDTQTEAYGYSADCPVHSIGWNVKSAMQAIANAKTASSITLGLRASDEDDMYGWKKFDHATMSISTTYNHKPEIPTPLTTSPAGNCTTSVMGDGDVTLYAGVRDTDGGTVTATFRVTHPADGSLIVSSTPVSATSGTRAAYTLTKATLESLLGTSAKTRVAWTVTASDGTETSGTSKACVFTFDPTRSGAPHIKDAASSECSASTLSYQVGTPATFTLAPNDDDTSGTKPDHYLYQLNGAAPATTAGTSISVTPTRGTNVLAVTAVSTGGNIGDTANCFIFAAPAATASDGDLTGDGHPDLTAVGAQVGLPSGYWLAHATDANQISAGATDIGAQGTGVNPAGSPTDWNGTQAITGHFNTGDGFNDVLDYNPATGAGTIIYGNGDGSPLSPYSGNEVNVSTTTFTDETGNTATSITNGGNLYHYLNQNPEDWTGYPDLLLINDGQLWDEPADPVPGAFTHMANALSISTANPTGNGDWTGWSITTTLDSNGLPGLFARDTSGSALYYYTADDLQNLAMGSSATPVQLPTNGLTVSEAPIIQAADLNGDGTPDLRRIDANGNVTAYLFNGSTITPQTAQKISSPDHVWPLDDGDDGSAATTAVDTTGSLTLTGSATGTTWDTDEALGNVLHLDGTGSMTTSAALSMSASFSVSLWAKPAAVGGVIASQDGTKNSGFLLYSQSNREWSFCMAITDTTRGYDCIAGGTAVIGQWAHLTATYNPTTKATNLYVDDRLVAHGTHEASKDPFTGKFTLGNNLNNGARASYFNGSVSNVQTWNGTVLTTDQVATMANLPLPTWPYTFTDVADYDGDGKADIVAADPTGDLWLYPGTGTGKFAADSLYIGTGFAGHTFAGIADFNKDGFADIIALTPSGALHLYPGDAGHDLLTPSPTFPSGWSGYAFAGVRDFNKDGKPDIIGRNPSGVLYLFPGTGTGAGIGSPIQLGTGWNNLTLVGVADIDEDGNPDVVARDSAGLLWNYHGNGSNDVSSPTQIGTGWNDYTIAGINDFNSDGNPDVIARYTDGSLWLYPRTATAFSLRVLIGHGW
ncbi:FG-GAP-like repeat-containing protein [Streptomyces sp. NPDC020983]|uniref:FG-GAP-like repeat-containing protein n=1 Tax=Streptomyces sp. NPDC020983 TaxID=3365106 RepID=UPI003799F10D